MSKKKPKRDKPIPDDEWESIVRNVPLVSVDLVVRHNGGVVLGLRENKPARGEWFVPGGTIMKNETLTEAVQRVAREELGCEVTIERKIGTFEHFYNSSEIEGVDSKHYLTTAFVVRPNSSELYSDGQHSQLRVFSSPEDGVHRYTNRYLSIFE